MSIIEIVTVLDTPQKYLSNLLSCDLSRSVAAVKDIDRYQEKITVSLHQASISPIFEHVKLGVFPREELPIHYR